MEDFNKDMKSITGFSKMSKREKIKWLVKNFFTDPEAVKKELIGFWHPDEDKQTTIDGFSENTISNYILPFSVAPNFVINGKTYCVPMVIEESSVVAAASSSAKFWADRGGFKSQVLSTRKIGHVHFRWNGDAGELAFHFPRIKKFLMEESAHLAASMVKRGGGILDIELKDFTSEEPGLYQLFASFETCDSMGANFINTVLEQFGRSLEVWFESESDFDIANRQVQVVMCILSNYTPNCIVRSEVSCPIEDLGSFDGGLISSEEFADKFAAAVRIARIDPYRATTHNKGIFNGIDAVVIATANDFRAIEACGHAYAARDGQYRSLSYAEVKDGMFRFWIDLPLAVGTVGGLTSLHPMAKTSLQLLGNPGAKELMQVIATVGLAQNFAAVRSLVTTGIQKGHMKMHLGNILSHLNATETEKSAAEIYFEDKTVSFSSVRAFLGREEKV
jgi:hydroxymethylglutaryl-CoA reductase